MGEREARAVVAGVAKWAGDDLVRAGDVLSRYAGDRRVSALVRDARKGRTVRLRFFFQDFARKASAAAVAKVADLVGRPTQQFTLAEHLARRLDSLAGD